MRQIAVFSLLALAASVESGAASELPAEIGACIESRIAAITSDFPGAPGGGSVIHYENGAQQLSFNKIDGLDERQVGDSVRICLVDQAKGCPPGDDRGRTYEGTNLRTGLIWRAPDTLVHNCNGA